MVTAAANANGASASQRCFGVYAWGVLGFNLLVVLWGAFVRATGSGAGCGSHWPLCNGQVVPRAPTLTTIIEFTHRITSGLDLLLVAGLLVWALRAFPPRHAVRLGAVLTSIFLVTEALLGAGLVLLDHVARNQSVARAYSLSLHLINTLTLIACLTLTAYWATGGPPVRVRGREGWFAFASLALTVLMGISGAIAALGDTLFPVTSLAEGWRLDFSGSAHIFVRLRLAHPFVAVAGGACLLYYTVSAAARDAGSLTGRIAAAGAVLILAQMLAGLLNVLLLAPVWLQILHLLLADLLWMSLVLLGARRLAVPVATDASMKAS
jgi:heme A synthase